MSFAAVDNFSKCQVGFGNWPRRDSEHRPLVIKKGLSTWLKW